MLTNAFNVAARDPVAVGLKVMVIVQDALGTRLAGQLWVALKSPGLVPVIVIPLNTRIAPLVLVLVKVLAVAALLLPTATVPKASLVGFSVAVGALPVPVRLTVVGVADAFE